MNPGESSIFHLRPYQRKVAAAVLDSVLHGKGYTFSVEIARQGGKNELSAQIELLLLTLFMAETNNLVKCSPTFRPQAVISMTRLKDRLNDAGFDGLWKNEQGYIIRLGNAREIFLSADESARVVGHTAQVLLEIDESQDVGKDKYSKEFRPMAAASNTTTVHYGTTWDETTLLEEVKQANLELEKKDGVRRHFRYDWETVARYVPAYRSYVESEKARLGEDHPMFLTQYRLLPLRGGGGLFTLRQQAQIQGTHPRMQTPGKGKTCIAGLDLAGEASDDPFSVRRERDSTVLTIGELDYSDCDEIRREPVIRVVEHCRWTGENHTELYPVLVDLIKNVWRCRKVAVDATGAGQPVASFLRKAVGSAIVPFVFSRGSKSKLGFDLLSAVNAGRLKVYAADGSDDYREFRFQVEKAKSRYFPNQTMDFFVDPSQGHDDYLCSLALLVEATGRYSPRGARGRTKD